MRSVLSSLDSIDLDTLQQKADLQTRLDRKYILPVGLAQEAITAFAPRLAVLEIDGQRDFAYESVYFDTPALESYFSSAHGRRRRFKVRTRSYLDSGASVLEVKTAGGRDETVKARNEYTLADRAGLTAEAEEFLAVNGLDPSIIEQLAPTLTTTYRRATLLDASGFRATMDTQLMCLTRDAQAELPDNVLLETKAPGAATDLDRWLWARGQRPIRVSKYCTGLAALTPGLAANKWNRTLRQHFNWKPNQGISIECTASKI